MQSVTFVAVGGKSSMNNQIREIVDSTVANLSKVAETNTIIGDAMVTADGTTIMPISQLSFAFVAGGGEYGKGDKKFVNNSDDGHFAGASGGGATLTPVGFLVVSSNGIEIINSPQESAFAKIMDVVSGFVNDKK